MGLYAGLALGAIGAVGGLVGNRDAQRRADAAMAGAAKYRNGAPRLYGQEQDALIKALKAGGSNQAAAEGKVARSDLGRELGQAEGSLGGIAGVRAAMGSGQESALAGGIGGAMAQERIGNYSAAGTNIAQAAENQRARDRLRLEALQLYAEAKKARKSGFEAAAGGFASGAMAGAAIPV